MRMTWAVAAALLSFAATAAHAQLPAAARREAWPVTGLQQPAQIIVDRWGISHIYAGSVRDAFFLQGYNAARDRLWQIDLWRKRGLGRLSASFGPAYVAQDRAARLLLYRGDMAREWAAYAPGARDAVTAWVDGVDAYVAEVRAGAKPLPIEFRLTASRPETWAPDDILRIRSHTLVGNVTSEVARAQVVCAGGVEADRLRRKIEPTSHKLAVPEGLNPCDIPADVLQDYILGTEPVSFEPLAGRKTAALDPRAQLAQRIDATSGEGSNNWTISGARTASGRPILANDPHRAVGVPSLRYIVHMEAPGLSIEGAGEPALPGVSLGHNADVAFGLTIFPIDQEDLYVYEINPAGDAYRYKGGWEPMKVVREAIEVKGEAPREVELRYTRHGPVLKIDPARRRAFALRTVWNEPGAEGYFQSSRLWRAKSWADFEGGRDAWGTPPLNLVYADRTGVIGWSAAGLTPVRPNWDGLMPVPGDGRYEWAGFLPGAELPWLKNPAKGWFATANAMNLPKGYPDEQRKVSFEWSDPSRITRIEEVLAAEPKGTIAQSTALQTDTVSAESRRLRALLRADMGQTPPAEQGSNLAKAIKLLEAWNGDERTDSAPAAIYEVWVSGYLGKGAAAMYAPRPARDLIGSGSLDAVIGFLESGEAGPRRKLLLLATLGAAVQELEQRLGPDMSTWTWGRLHRAEFQNPAGVLADRETAARMAVGPVAVPGSASTPRAATYRPELFTQVAGASVRMVLDVGQWDNSMVVNTPGQSGDPANPHYRDLFAPWAAGDYVPLRYTRPAVEAAAETVLDLTPKR
ncbi:MAG TPA: penicillin acylase family protein [Phenylobacterium sp.]|uniref:penicillin acylase family protein n=1 Tax=Phenylobacterium sp. TaxID=1871053 RepID=UPI002CD09830|nr:penicillin acylase family protein [Phenylobacterium sp.]HSV02750.1 penicillin acylase family protein [Phenylobacterium sp.]